MNRIPSIETMVDISKKSSPHTWKNRLMRVIWHIVYLLLFRTSPKPFHSWRRMLLRIFGAKMGTNSCVHPSVKIWAPWNLTMADNCAIGPKVDCYCAAPVYIGSNTTVSQYSYLCTATHDISDQRFTLVTSPIVIKDQVWICADVFIAPGVTIDTGSVVGARSSVFKNLDPWTIYAGCPAKPVRSRKIEKNVTENQLEEVCS